MAAMNSSPTLYGTQACSSIMAAMNSSPALYDERTIGP